MCLTSLLEFGCAASSTFGAVSAHDRSSGHDTTPRELVRFAEAAQPARQNDTQPIFRHAIDTFAIANHCYFLCY